MPPLQVRELLGETGQVVAMWMPSIKTHCYAVMETKQQAEDTRRVGGTGRVGGWVGWGVGGGSGQPAAAPSGTQMGSSLRRLLRLVGVRAAPQRILAPRLCCQ